jgi:hypothetical protein
MFFALHQEVLVFYNHGNPPDGKLPLPRFPGISNFFGNDEDLGKIKVCVCVCVCV